MITHIFRKCKKWGQYNIILWTGIYIMIICIKTKRHLLYNYTCRRHADVWSHPSHYMTHPPTPPWWPIGHGHGHEWLTHTPSVPCQSAPHPHPHPHPHCSNKANSKFDPKPQTTRLRTRKGHPVYIFPDQYFLCPRYLRFSSNGFGVRSKSHRGGGGGGGRRRRRGRGGGGNELKT